MEKQETVFDFLGQMFLLFGITVLMLLCMSVLFGNDVRDYSVMFSLGNEGLPTGTLIQFLLVSVMVIGLKFLFFTEKWIKDWTKGRRTIAMLGSILIIMSLFIYLFKWFPMNSWLPWVMFFLCFIISFIISSVVVLWKEKLENKRMDEGLKRLKAQLGEVSDEHNH